MFNTELFSVESLYKEFGVGNRLYSGTKKIAVNHVSFSVQENMSIGLVGESGSGKTTIAKCLDILEKPTSGDIKFRGQSIFHLDKKGIRDYRSQVQMVFQDPYSSLDPQKTVDDLISEPLIIYKEKDPAFIRQKTDRIMELVGLPKGFRIRYPHELSGGQRQRVAIARALVVSPSVLIADEPVSALDVSTQAQILNLLKTLKQELNLTLIFISHDLAIVKYICDYLVVLKDGNVVEQGSSQEIFGRPASEYFTNLIDAVPRSSPYDF